MVISGSGLEATPTGCSQMKTKGSGRALYRKRGEYKLFVQEHESFEHLTYK